jgi:cyclic beta-1,2-glucan synthetase
LAAALAATGVIVALVALPRVASLPFAILPGRAGITSRSHVAALGGDTALALTRSGLALVLLPFTAWSMLDAILRTAPQSLTRNECS